MPLHVLLWSLRSAALTRLLRRHPLPGEGDPFHHHQSSALMLGKYCRGMLLLTARACHRCAWQKRPSRPGGLVAASCRGKGCSRWSMRHPRWLLPCVAGHRRPTQDSCSAVTPIFLLQPDSTGGTRSLSGREMLA